MIKLTLREKAKEMFGEGYIKECPSKVFGIGCFADNSYPFCGHESCWKEHQTDAIEWKENPKDMFSQQVFDS
jgi:hypothetical protein